MTRKKNSSLVELCNLIAEEGATYAYRHKELFLNIVKETTGKVIPDEKVHMIYKIFSFLNWAYANGVWSNLSKTSLRRDLMRQSMQSIVPRTSYELAENKSNEAVAFLASELEREFRQFVSAYMERVKALSTEGIEADANTATLWGLEQIQNYLGLNDDQMNLIVPQFNNQAVELTRIEDIAKQVNLAASKRKKGFFSRLFGSE